MFTQIMLSAGDLIHHGGLVRFDAPIWLWLAFVAGLVALLLLNLAVLHRDAHAISLREAWLTSSPGSAERP